MALGLLSLAAFSFLIKENKFYNIAGVHLSEWEQATPFVMAWSNIQSKGFGQIAQGDYLTIVPVLLGLCLFGKMSKSTAWIGRYPAAMLMGMGSAIAIRGAVQSELVRQIAATCVPLNSVKQHHSSSRYLGHGELLPILNEEHRFPAVRRDKCLVKQGRWVMMVSFGAAFANATMQRCAQAHRQAEIPVRRVDLPNSLMAQNNTACWPSNGVFG